MPATISPVFHKLLQEPAYCQLATLMPQSPCRPISTRPSSLEALQETPYFIYERVRQLLTISVIR
jgi:hypothetical protein